MKLGSAFSDAVVFEKGTRKSHDDRPAWWFGTGRVLLFTTVGLVAFAILFFRLFQLTIIRGHEYRVLADDNRTRELIRHAPRGILRDRTGEPLVDNIPQYRLVTPCDDTRSNKTCVTRISQAEGETLSKKGLPPGEFLEVDYERVYRQPTALAHVLGYTGELSQKELEDEYYALRSYRLGDRVGRVGAEVLYEERLRGRDGRELVEVDASGHIVRTLGRDPEIIGGDMTLSLDAKLAAVAQSAFPAGYKGAVIVTKPSTGEILAMYSSPSFSLNAFSLGMSQKEYDTLVGSPDRPMFNRAIGGVYPPGSTFKPIVAIAGLEEGKITKTTTIEDTGIIHIGPFSFSNWFFTKHGKTDGIVDLVKALQRSNDIFFYKVGEKVGITSIASWARKFGIGKPLGIELSGEASGLVPDAAWKEKQFTSPADIEARNNQWYTGDTYHISIGQGYLLTTPLQVAAWTNAIANGGKLCRPTIEKVDSAKLKVYPDHRGVDSCKDLGIKKENLALITEGMVAACSEGGTGWPFFGFTVRRSSFIDKEVSVASVSATNHEPVTMNHVPVACKTGTAEFGHPTNETHAWFTVFAPVPTSFVSEDLASQPSQGKGVPLQRETITGEPEIAVTVLVEEGGEGSTMAAPVAKKVLEEWFSR